VNPDHEDLLRRLALNDEGALESLLGMRLDDPGRTGLDARMMALVRLAGLVALDAAPASYQWGVTAALAVGATDGEVVGVLAALGPVVGTTRVNAAAAEVALAIGYDLGLPGDP
jgi:4-carboxymuconolactone decarboxylase